MMLLSVLPCVPPPLRAVHDAEDSCFGGVGLGPWGGCFCVLRCQRSVRPWPTLLECYPTDPGHRTQGEEAPLPRHGDCSTAGKAAPKSAAATAAAAAVTAGSAACAAASAAAAAATAAAAGGGSAGGWQGPQWCGRPAAAQGCVPRVPSFLPPLPAEELRVRSRSKRCKWRWGGGAASSS